MKIRNKEFTYWTRWNFGYIGFLLMSVNVLSLSYMKLDFLLGLYLGFMGMLYIAEKFLWLTVERSIEDAFLRGYNEGHSTGSRR